MSSKEQEQSSFQQLTELSENMTLKQLIAYLANQEEKDFDMEETSGSFSESM